MDMRPEIELHVGTLVIDGVSEAAGARAGSALAQELTRLLEDAGLSSRLTADLTIDHLYAGTLPAGGGSSSALGTDVARAVHHSMAKERLTP
jgi:hypothetical protein